MLAHLVESGFGGFYDGILHLLITVDGARARIEGSTARALELAQSNRGAAVRVDLRVDARRLDRDDLGPRPAVEGDVESAVGDLHRDRRRRERYRRGRGHTVVDDDTVDLHRVHLAVMGGGVADGDRDLVRAVGQRS